MKVGFIGLGTMGNHMAHNLQKAGYDLVVYDIRREAAQRHITDGATWADSPKAVGQQADIVFTSLPGPPEVEAVALGDNGLLAGMKNGSAWFDLSTNSPTLIRRLEKTFAEKGIHVMDSPVSGGPSGAESGRLAIWIGGEEGVFRDHKKVLDAIGDQVAYAGPSGAGAVTKLVHNCGSAIIQMAQAEVFSLGVKAGVDPLELWKSVRQGAGGRFRTYDRMLNDFLPAKFDPANFQLKLMHKDVKLATELGRELDVPMRMANMALADYTEGLVRGWGTRDSHAAMLLQEERAGVNIKVDEARIEEAKKLL
ncbi:MAG: NAD(P)-dependent oxidoreductase [Chloroflexi bacterium]|nr:NAD(P)-dependent oxidoreductase [Chloroflexota bacterium]